MNNKWKIAFFDGSDSVKELHGFLQPEFCRLFGPDVMTNETCVVFNDPTSECPMLITNKTPVMIRLSQVRPNCWAQTVYQLSHEMCHYAFRQKKADKDFTLKWMEETICEAVSLYALEYCAQNWNKCLLAKRDLGYSRALVSYLCDELLREYKNGLMACRAIEQLEAIEKDADEKREERRRERNELYYAISRNPTECIHLLDLYQYVNQDKLTINFEAWEKDNPATLIRYLGRIQPVLEE